MSNSDSTGKTCTCDYCEGTGKAQWDCGVVLDIQREVVRLTKMLRTLQDTVDFYAEELDKCPDFNDN